MYIIEQVGVDIGRDLSHVDLRIATTTEEAMDLYTRMMALVGRTVDAGIREHMTIENRQAIEAQQ